MGEERIGFKLGQDKNGKKKTKERLRRSGKESSLLSLPLPPTTDNRRQESRAGGPLATSLKKVRFFSYHWATKGPTGRGICSSR